MIDCNKICLIYLEPADTGTNIKQRKKRDNRGGSPASPLHLPVPPSTSLICFDCHLNGGSGAQSVPQVLASLSQDTFA